ncbi:MAG: hypothetical protein ACRC9L_02300 [Brevinema sp.]
MSNLTKFAKNEDIFYNTGSMKYIRSSFFFFIALPMLVFAQYSQQILRESLSTQELDTGIALFNERRYAAAIQAFEKSIAHEPRNYAARYRLGLAYLYAGYPQNAASSWEGLVSIGAADYQVTSKLNEVYSMLSETELEVMPLDYTFTGYFDGFTQAAHRLQRGSFVTYDELTDRKFISSFATGGVLELDGLNIIRREYGRRFLFPSVLKNPTGIVTTSNLLYVADFQQDKIFIFNRDITGSLNKSFGEKGAGYGQLSGVMGLGLGKEGYIYVVNSGNARIDRFTQDGTFVSTFGGEYLFRPTDIEITDTHIYVTDISVDGRGRLIVFNNEGRFIKMVGSELLQEPRGLFLDDDNLYISDARGGLYIYDIAQDFFRSFMVQDNRLSSPFDLIKDKDGVIMRTDFNSQVMALYAPSSVLYANLNVDLVQMNTDNYPYMYAVVRVRHQDGTPFMGLTPEEFSIKEFNTPMERPVVSGTEKYREKLLLSFIIDGSSAYQQYMPQFEYFFKSIVSNLNGDDRFGMVIADDQPEYFTVTNAAILNAWNFITNRRPAQPEPQMMDQIIYDETTKLFNNLRNRALIVFTEGSGDLNTTYGADVLSAYAERNNIPIYVINSTGKNEAVWKLLAQSTHGRYFDARRDAAAIVNLVDTIKKSPPLEYLLEYQSSILPEAKTWVDWTLDINRAGITGRAVSGYYRPIRLAKPVNIQDSFFPSSKE